MSDATITLVVLASITYALKAAIIGVVWLGGLIAGAAALAHAK